MDDAEFRATLVDYIRTRACVNAADEDVYMRFLEKQAVLEQATAVQQLASVRRVQALVAEINSEVENLRICGLTKLYNVCSFVRSQPKPGFHAQTKWVVCCVSSLTTSECVVMGENSEWCVDVSFRPFLQMLWIVSHVDSIEYSKFVLFVNSRPATEKTIDSLRHIEKSAAYVCDAHVAAYMTAFQHVLATLRSTIHHFTHAALGAPGLHESSAAALISHAPGAHVAACMPARQDCTKAAPPRL